MKALDADTAVEITSLQAIMTPVSVVKELLENALDAGASLVQIKSRDLFEVTVTDDGIGIPENSIPMLLKRVSSKIMEFKDGNGVSTLGFRGQALHAISCLAKINLDTKTCTSIGRSYKSFGNEFRFIGVKAMRIGSQFTVSEIFTKFPVRQRYCRENRQYFIREIRQLVKRYGLVYSNVVFSLKIDSEPIVFIPKLCIPAALSQVLGAELFKSLAPKSMNLKINSNCVIIDAYLPSDENASFSNPDHVYYYVNKRPLDSMRDELGKGLISSIKRCCNISKYPACLLALEIPPKLVDVNCEPDKRVVIVQYTRELIDLFEKEVKEHILNMQTSAISTSRDSIQNTCMARKAIKRPISIQKSDSSNKNAKKPNKVLQTIPEMFKKANSRDMSKVINFVGTNSKVSFKQLTKSREFHSRIIGDADSFTILSENGTIYAIAKCQTLPKDWKVYAKIIYHLNPK